MRKTLLLLALALLAFAAQPAEAGGVDGGAAIALPGPVAAPGSGALVLAPGPVATARVEVWAYYSAGGGVNRSFTATVTLEGVPWPFLEGYYAFPLPALPYWTTIIVEDAEAYNATVASSIVLEGENWSVRIMWRPGGGVLEPLAVLAVDGYTRWTMGLAPAGWSLPAGEELGATIIAAGLDGEPRCLLTYGPPGSPGASSAPARPTTYNELLARLAAPGFEAAEWLEQEAGLPEGSVPRPLASGGVCRASIPGLPAGSGVSYRGVAYTGTTTVETLTGTLWYHRRDGPRIVVVDDDLLLESIAGYTPPAGVSGEALGSLPALSSIAGSLAEARMIAVHDWSVPAMLGRLYIAFPGEEAVEALGEGARVVYFSGLPPVVPGTLLDWSPWAGEMAALAEELAHSGAGVGASYSSLAVCTPYPELPRALAGILGLPWLARGDCTSLPGAVVESSPAQTWLGQALGAPVPAGVEGLPTLAGWQKGLLPAEGLLPEDTGAYLAGAWSRLAGNPLLQGVYQDMPAKARGVVEQVEEAWRAGAWNTSDYKLPPAPVYLGGGAGLFALDAGTYRGVYASFEPEASGNRPLMNWIFAWLLETPSGLWSVAGVELPAQAMSLLEGGGWESRLVAHDDPLVLDSQALVAAVGGVPEGAEPLEAASTVVLARAGPGTLGPPWPYPAGYIVYKVLYEPTTTTTATTTTWTSQTTTTETGGGATTTTTGGGTGTPTQGPEYLGPSPLLAAALAASALTVAALIIYWRRRKYTYY